MTEVAALGLRVDGVSNIDQAEKSLSGFATSAEKADKSTSQLSKAAREAKGPFDKLNTSLSSAAKGMLALGAAAVSFAATSRTLADFEDSMAQVSAITRANTKELQAMRDMAKQLGATTRFSASEAADGLKFLGMAGFTAAEGLASIPAVLNLATASAMGLGEAADIATNIMSGFGIAAQNAADVADVLAAASSRSNTTVQQLGGAMSTVAPISRSLGISLEDTAAAIGTLSDAGIQGERAGTTMRGALAALAGPTTQAQRTLKALGLTIQDVNPQTNDLSVVFGRLRDAGLTTAQAMTIFGREAASGALVLTQAAARVGEFGEELGNVAGEAQRMADIMADSLGGDFKELQSVVESVILALGEAGLTAILRSVTQTATLFLTAAVRLINTVGDLAGIVSTILSPAIKLISPILKEIAKNADIAGAALLVMAGPVVITAINSLTKAIGVGLVASIRAVTIALRANPIGAIVSVLTAAVYAAYQFRDKIGELIGIDVPKTFRQMAISVAGAIDPMFQGMLGNISAFWAGLVALGNNIFVFFSGIFDQVLYAAKLFVKSFGEALNQLPFIDINLPEVDRPEAFKGYMDFIKSVEEGYKAGEKWLSLQDALIRKLSDDSIWEVGTKAFEDYSKIIYDIPDPGDGLGDIPGAIDALRKWVTEATFAAESAHALTFAYLEGGDAIAATTRQLLIEEQVLQHGAAARGVITKAIENQEKALSRLDVAKQINELREQNKQSQSYVAVLAAQSKGYHQGRQALTAYNREQALNSLLLEKNAEEVADLVEEYRELWNQSDAISQMTDANNELNRLVESTRTSQEKYNAELQRLVALRPYAQTAEQAEALNRAIDDLNRKNSDWITFTEDAIERINSAFADMWRDVFEGSRSAMDGMKRAFRQMLAEMAHAAITKPIIISVGNAIMGTNTPGGVGDGGGIFGRLGGGSSNLGGMITSAGNWLGSETISNFGSGFSFGSGAIMGPPTAAQAGSGAYQTGSLFGEYGGSILGYGKAIFDLTQGNYGSAVGTAIGTYIMPGLGTVIGSTLGGVVDSIFGDRLPTTRRSKQGASHMLPDGTFEISAFDSRQSEESQEAARDFAQSAVKHANELFQKIGVDAGIYSFQTLMESSVLGDKQGVGSSGILRLGESLIDIGLAVESSWSKHGVGGWSEAEMLPRLQADIQLTLLEAFQAAGDALPNLLSSMLEGVDIRGIPVEEALALSETFSQLVIQIEQTQEALLSLPFEYLRDVTFEATANLIEYAGGVQNLQTGMQNYFQNFHSVEEQLAYETKLLTEAFAEVGFVMPDMTRGAQESKDALRSFVESLDPLTEEGQRGIAMAYTLAQRFSDLADGIEGLNGTIDSVLRDAQNAFRDAVSAGENAYRALSRAVEKERAKIQSQAQKIGDALRDSISVTSQTISELTSLSNRLTSTMQRMVSTGISDERNRGWAQNVISGALQAGAIDQTQEFEHALQIIAQPSQGLFSSFEDYQADFLRSAHDVAALNEITGVQLTTEQRALESLESQLAQNDQWYESEMARLDGILEYQRQRLDIAAGTYEAVLSIPEAIDQVTAAVKNIQIANAAVQKATQSSSMTREEKYFANNPDVAAAFRAGQGGSMTAAELARYHYETYGKYEGRSFDVGTNYVPYDMYGVNVHEGERIVPKADNAEMIGLMRVGATSGRAWVYVQQEIRELKDTVKELLTENNDMSYDQLEELRRQSEEEKRVRVVNVVPTVEAVPGQ